MAKQWGGRPVARHPSGGSTSGYRTGHQKASMAAIVLYNASSEETRRYSDASADDRIGQSEPKDLGWCHQSICIIYAAFCEQPIGTSCLVSKQHSRGNVQWWLSRSPTSSEHQWLKIPTGFQIWKQGQEGGRKPLTQAKFGRHLEECEQEKFNFESNASNTITRQLKIWEILNFKKANHESPKKQGILMRYGQKA